MLRVLHLTGSAVDDDTADLSLVYARDCWDACADPARYEFVAAHVSPDGSWRFPADLSAEAIADAAPWSAADGLAHVGALAPDVAVPQMFCRPGMTAYRAALEVLGVPVVGNRAETMALGADKSRARAVVAAAGVDVPDGQVVGPGEQPDVALPVVVKPVDADNSVGVHLVRDAADLAPALEDALSHSGRALVERYVEAGREVRCGVLERDDDLVCLPLEEYPVDADRPVRTAADKLARTADGELYLVAKDAAHAWVLDPSDPVTETVWDAARRAHRALGCRRYGLFDLRVDPEGRPWFLEAGLYCSFARSSVLAVMAAAAGIGVRDLFDEAVRQELADPATRRLPC